MTLKPTTRLWIWVIALLGVGLAAIYLLLQIPVLSIPMLLAVAFFYVLEPLIVRWESHGHTRASALIIIFATLSVLGIFVLLQIPGWLQEQWLLIQQRGPAALALARERIAAVDLMIQQNLPFATGFAMDSLVKNLVDYVRVDLLPNLPGLVAQILMGILLMPIVTFFLLVDGRRARKRLLEMVPNRNFEMALNIFYRMDQQVGSYLRGVIIEAFLVGMVAYTCLALLGVPGAALIAGVVGVTNLIPYFGPVAGLVTGIIYCGLAGNLDIMAWRVVAAVAVAQLSDNFIIGPAVIGKAVNVHALVVILLLLVAGNLFGLIGLVVAVPLWAVIRVVLQETVTAVHAYGRFIVD